MILKIVWYLFVQSVLATWLTAYDKTSLITNANWITAQPPSHYFLCGLSVGKSAWTSMIAQTISTTLSNFYNNGPSELSVTWCNEFNPSDQVTNNLIGTGSSGISCPIFHFIDRIEVYASDLRFFNAESYASKQYMGSESHSYDCKTIYDIAYLSEDSNQELRLDVPWKYKFLTHWGADSTFFKCLTSSSDFGDPRRGHQDSCWCETPNIFNGITQLGVQCKDQYDQTRTSESIKTTTSYSHQSSMADQKYCQNEEFVCGIQVAVESVQSNNEGIYGLKLMCCEVVRCETLLIKGNSASSKTEKLIEGETRYEYLDIFPNFIKNLDDSGDCGTISCKLLNKCQPNDEIISTNILITSDFRIQMDTDPANEFYYDLCVACSNRNTTIYSDNFFLHTYYPCEDEFKPRNSVPSQSELIVPQNAGVYAETKIQYNITEFYLVNSDTDHCDVKNCTILQGGVGLSEEFFWADKDFININTDPKEEFYLENLQVQCSNRNITVISPTFNIECNCTNNIVVWTPTNFKLSQTCDTTLIDAQKSAFVFDSFKTTTSACQVEKYFVYNSLTNRNYPTGMTQLNPILDAHTLRVENANSFSLPVIDGTNPFRFNFVIYVEINGGSTWHVDSLVLTTKCPTVLEFYQISYNDALESYIGAPQADSMVKFPATIPTLSKCNEVIDYQYSIISYKDLSGSTLTQTSNTLKFYEGCNSSPCLTLHFDTTQAGEILYKITPIDTENQAQESQQLSIKIFENPQPPRISNYLLYARVTDGDSNKQETNPQFNIFVTESVVFTFQPFKCSSATCVVTNYQLSSSYSSLAVASGASAPTFNSQTGLMEIALDDYNVLGVYEFYIYANLQLFNQVEVFSNKVTITVECGNEVITTSLSRYVLPIYNRNDGTKTINFSDLIASYFTVNKNLCPITNYVAYSDSQGVNILANSQIILADANSPSSSRLEISTTQPLKLSLYLEAQTQKGVRSPLLEIEAVVCGNELIFKNQNPDLLYVRQIGDSLQFTEAEYSLYFTRSFDPITSDLHCTAVKEYAVFSDSACSVTSNRIQKDGTNIVIDTSTPFSMSQFCIRAETNGGNYESQIFNVEVCGTETVSISSNGNENSITKVFTKAQIPTEINIDQEGFFAQSSSTNCGIVSQRLLEGDQSTTLTHFSLVKNLIQINNNNSYNGTFYVEYSTVANVARLPIHLKICGYEQVEADLESPQKHEISKYLYKQAFSYSFKSNDSSCDISNYKLFDQKTGQEITNSSVITFDNQQVFIDPQQVEDFYIAEQLTFYVEATTSGDSSSQISYSIDLTPKVLPSELANVVNFAPYFSIDKLYFQYQYFPTQNIENFQTGELIKKYYRIKLPLIKDNENDKIQNITDVTWRIYLNRQWIEVKPPPTFYYFDHDYDGEEEIIEGQRKVSLVITNKDLTHKHSGRYKIEVVLQDDRGASQTDEILLDLAIDGADQIDFKDVESLKKQDFDFAISGRPSCEMMQRIHSFEISYNCTFYTDDYEIYQTMLEPALIIDLPDEEFYSKINPDVGFEFVRGKLRAAIAFAEMEKRVADGEEPVAFDYMVDICQFCVRVDLVADAAPDGAPCIINRQLVTEKDRAVAVYTDEVFDGIKHQLWKGFKNEYSDVIQQSLSVKQVVYPEFTKIKMIQTERDLILKLFFSKEMFQIPNDQIKLLNQIFEITTISENDQSTYEANWIIEDKETKTKIVVTKTKKEGDALIEQAFKKLKFNCTYYQQDSAALYFKIDFWTPIQVSQSIFGKDKIQVKIKPNELIKDMEGIPLNRFNNPFNERLNPQPFSYEDQETIEQTLESAQLFIMFLQANMLVLNILLSKSLQDLWGMLNTQQITIHMMLFRCSYTIPSNMFVFNSYMSQLTQKDMYPSDEIFALIFEFTEKDSPIEHFETLGYEGANFVSMTGSLLINIVISVCLSIFLRFSDFVARKLYRWKYARYYGSRITHSNVIGAILTLYLQGFLEMLICLVVTLGEMQKEDFQNNASDFFAAVFAVISGIIMGVMLVFILYILKFDPNEPGMMSELHTFIYADISMENRWQSIFLSIFLLRRSLFVYIIYFLEPYLGSQLILHIILTIMYTAYFAIVKPYTSPGANEWEIFNEVCVIIVSYSLMFLTSYDDDAMTRYNVGWIYILLISFNIFCNAYKIFKEMVTKTIPQGYREFNQKKQAEKDKRRLEQWIEDKLAFCKEHPEIAMTKIINEIAEITKYLQENIKLVVSQDKDLQIEILWLKKHDLDVKILDEQVAEVRKQKKKLIKKEARLERLNKRLQKKFNQINQNVRERAIREAIQENRHQLRDRGVTFEDVLIATQNVEQNETKRQNQTGQVNLAYTEREGPRQYISKASNLEPEISQKEPPLLRKNCENEHTLRQKSSQRNPKSLILQKEKPAQKISSQRTSQPESPKKNSKGPKRNGKKKVPNMNIQDEFVLQNMDLDDIMRQNGGSTPKFGERK